MPDSGQLSRRERQIMSIIYERGSATVNAIREQLPDPPTPMAVRRLLAILVQKGFLKSRKAGRENVYVARQRKGLAGSKALREVLDTFFEGSIGQALAMHLGRPGSKLTEEEVARLSALVEELKQAQDSPAEGAEQ